MAVYHVKNTGARTTGASTPDDWTDANCYGVIDTALSQMLTTGDEMILDDDNFVSTSLISGTRFDDNKIWSSRGGNASNCVLDVRMATSNGFNMNTGVASSTLTVNKITLKRTLATTGQYVLFQASGSMTDVTFNQCIFDDFNCTLSGGSNDLGLVAYGALTTSRIFTFNACSFSNIRLSGGTGGAVIGRFRTGTVKFIGGCTFDSITCSSAGATHRGFIWCDGAKIEFGDHTSRNAVSNIKSTQTATNANRSFIQAIASMDIKIYRTDISNMVWIGGTAGTYFCYAPFTYEVEDLTAKDCISTPSVGDNSVGGVFLAITVNATGTYKNVRVKNCVSDFGPAYYASDGAEGTLENVVAANCACKHGAIYTGGYGDLTGYGILVYGTTRLATATNEKGLALYGHNHPTTSTRNKVVTLAGCTFIDNVAPAGEVGGLRFLNDNVTFSLTVQIDNCVIANGGAVNDEVFGDGVGATTYNTDFCSIEGGTSATSGFTNANLKTWLDSNLEDRANNNYELTIDATLLGIGKTTNTLKQSANDNPFPSFDIDIGGLQSIYGPFHPRQLSGPSIFGGIPKEYRATIYGDSYSDSGGGTGWIGQTLNTNTSVDFILREQATGGDLVSEIRTAFEADFPFNRDNLVILQGAINSIRTDVSLGSIQADWSAMADAVLQADNIDLLVVNQSPWFGHAQWTEARQLVTEQFNAWLAGKYGNYLADTYTALGDPAEPRQLADEFYKLVRTDSHPSRNGDVVIDDNLGELLYYDVPEITRSAELGNSHAFPNSPASWSANLRATIGGNLIRMCDGTYSNVNGIIPSADSITHIARHSFTAPPNGSSITVRALLKPGQHQWARIEYKDNAAGLHNAYVDLLNVVFGTETGTFTWSISKAARGWIELIGVGSSGTGVGANNVTIFPAEANGDSNFVGDTRTPSTYVDRVQFIIT